MLLHMGGNGSAIHGFECVFQRGGVHQKFAGQFLNGDPFGEMLHQIVMDIPDDGFLRCLKIHGFFRTGDLHYLLHDLVQQPDLLCLRGFVIDFFSDTPADQQTAFRQGAQVMRNGGTGHFQHGGNVDDALLLMAQQPENAYTGGVTQLLEHVGNGGKMHGIHQLFVQAGSVGVLSMMMGQRKIGHKASSCIHFGNFLRLFGSKGCKPLAFSGQ